MCTSPPVHSCILWLSLTGDIINQPGPEPGPGHGTISQSTLFCIFLHFTELCLETLDWTGQLLTVALVHWESRYDLVFMVVLSCCTFFLQSIDILAAMDTLESPGMENLSPN